MKKLTTILLSMLLVLSIGQAVWAKGSVNLGVGYSRILEQSLPNGMSLSLDADYYFTENFALAAGFNTDLYFEDFHHFFTFDLFAKYDLLKTNVTTVGLQLGLMDNITKSLVNGNINNVLFIVPGIYANFNVGANFNLYTDIKLPVGGFIFNMDRVFHPLYGYDLKLGATYEITSNINIGLEANFSNCNFISFVSLNPEFSIEAKVGYKF